MSFVFVQRTRKWRHRLDLNDGAPGKYLTRPTGWPVGLRQMFTINGEANDLIRDERAGTVTCPEWMRPPVDLFDLF
jgi:hypothetical protein